LKTLGLILFAIGGISGVVLVLYSWIDKVNTGILFRKGGVVLPLFAGCFLLAGLGVIFITLLS
jgi:hypothetical protein